MRVDTVMILADDAVFTMSEHAEDKISKQINNNAETLEWDYDEKGHYVLLAPGNYYLFDSVEYVEVPDTAAGKLIHRSSANRASMRIESGVYDSGFKGHVGGSITVVVPMKLYRGTRVAQLVMWSADSNGEYNGQWQDKNSVGV